MQINNSKDCYILIRQIITDFLFDWFKVHTFSFLFDFVLFCFIFVVVQQDKDKVFLEIKCDKTHTYTHTGKQHDEIEFCL